MLAILRARAALFITISCLGPLACSGEDEDRPPGNGDGNGEIDPRDVVVVDPEPYFRGDDLPGPRPLWTFHGPVLDEARCEALTLSTSSARPLESVEVTGIPESAYPAHPLAAGPLHNLVAMAHAGDEATPVLFDPVRGESLTAYLPLHPSVDPDGGAVEIRIGEVIWVDDAVEVYWCPEAHPFQIEPLPAADPERNVAAVFAALDEFADEMASVFGTSADELAATDADDVHPARLPIWSAVRMLRDEDGIPAFLDVLAADPAQQELADRLMTHVGLAGHIENRAIEGTRGFDRLDVTTYFEDLEHLGQERFLTGCMEVDAQELADMMQLQHAAAELGTGDSGIILSYLDGLADVLGLVPGAVGVAATVGSITLYIFETIQAGLEHLNPSEFARYDISFSPSSFIEDAEGADARGSWQDFHVTASSQRWSLDKVLIDGGLEFWSAVNKAPILEAINVLGRVADLDEKVTDTLITSALEHAAEFFGVEDADGNPGSFVSVPSRCWESDLSDPQWSRAIYSGAITAGDDEHFEFQLDPNATIDQPAQIWIETREDVFPNQLGFSRPVPITPVWVRLTPGFHRVLDPPEEIAVSVEVHAHDPAVIVHANDEVIFDSEAAGSEGPTHQFTYTFPDEERHTVRLRAVSTSESGLRANPDAPSRHSTGAHWSQSEDDDDDQGPEIDPSTGCEPPAGRWNYHYHDDYLKGFFPDLEERRTDPVWAVEEALSFEYSLRYGICYWQLPSSVCRRPWFHADVQRDRLHIRSAHPSSEHYAPTSILPGTDYRLINTYYGISWVAGEHSSAVPNDEAFAMLLWIHEFRALDGAGRLFMHSEIGLHGRYPEPFTHGFLVFHQPDAYCSLAH